MQVTDVARQVQENSPVDLISILGPAYYRYLNLKANKKHSNDLDVSPHPASNTPNHILVVVVDALRPDFVPDLPLEFSKAIAPGTWTFPSVTSMQTGLYPHEHGAVAHNNPDDDDALALPKQYDGSLTLPAFLEAAGFETYLGAGFINPFLALQGWFGTHRVYGDADAQKIVSDYQDWRASRKRTYGYLQLSDLHAPIKPPADYARKEGVDTSLDGLSSLEKYANEFENAPDNWREQRLSLYQGALNYIEDTLKEVVADLMKDTFLIVVGDHGEAMWEHYELDQQFADSRPKYGVGHGGTPYDMIARVPAAIHHPDRSPNVSGGGWFSGRDIPQTVCSGLGIDDSPFEGMSWFDDIPDEREVLCEATGYGTERKAIYKNKNKIIHSETDNVTLDATVREGSGEEFDTLSVETIQCLVDSLPDHWDNMDLATETSAMVEGQLKALGYK